VLDRKDHSKQPVAGSLLPRRLGHAVSLPRARFTYLGRSTVLEGRCRKQRQVLSWLRALVGAHDVNMRMTYARTHLEDLQVRDS
jgi:hypothetical protein